MAWRPKDATVLLVDVGCAMREATTVAGLVKISKTDVAVGMARSFMQQKLLFSPKHEVGIVLFGAKETKNDLQEDGYENVFVGRDGTIAAPTIDALRYLTDASRICGGEESDAVNGLVVTLDLLIKRTREQKYRKSIYLITDNTSVAPGDEDILECVKQLESTGTQLHVVVVGASDWGEWAPLAEMSPGVQTLPLVAAMRECSLCVKQVEQRAKVRLSLVLSPDVQIPVGVYTRTVPVRLPTLRKRSRLAAAVPPEHQKTDKVIVERTYHVADDPDGEEVKAEDRIKGHKYGKSIVPMSEYDEAALMYTCDRTLTGLGFALANSVYPEHSLGHIETIAADKGDKRAYFAFESLVDAMLAEGRVLIARYSFRKNSPPRMVVLHPNKAEAGQASTLEMQYLPFMEDVREWSFASLPEPSREQRNAVSLLVDAMDLEHDFVGSTAGVSSVRTLESLCPEDTNNPSLRRFYDFLVQRAMDPSAKVPPPAPAVGNTIELPPQVLERLRSSKVVERLSSTFGLAKVEKQTGKRKRFWREAIADKRRERVGAFGEVDTTRIKTVAIVKKDEKEEEKMKDEASQDRHGGAAGMALPVGPPPRIHIGTVNPVQDFNHWLAQRGGGIDVVGTAIEQMRGVTERLVDEDDDFHPKAIHCLTALRRGCVCEGEVAAFNDFARKLRVIGGIGRRARFWEKARNLGLGLITDVEVPTSSVSAEDARAFLAGIEFCSPRETGVGASTAGAAGAMGSDVISDRDLEAMIE